MLKEIKVSVCMITYKHELFLKQAIESILSQVVNFNIDFIIADDNSPDKTPEIVNSFSSHPNFSWIRYVRHSSNKGMISNFQWALEQCTGKYIALCEGDDYWTDPLKLQKQVDFLEANDDIELIFTDSIKFVTNTGEKVGQKNKSGTFKINSIIKEEYHATTSTSLFRNILNDEILNRYDLMNAPVGDFFLWLLLLHNNKKGYHMSFSTSVYRINETGIWSTLPLKHKLLQYIKIYKHLKKFQFIAPKYKTIFKNRIIIRFFNIVYARSAKEKKLKLKIFFYFNKYFNKFGYLLK